MCFEMRPVTRDRLLHEEGAFCAPRDQKDPEMRKRRRKYRKLRRMAEKQGIDLGRLLLRRKADRQWEQIKASVGQRTLWREDYRYAYVVEIVRVFRERVETSRYNQKIGKYRPGYETRRAVHVRVLGVERIHDTSAPTLTWDAPYPVGAEAIALPRSLDVWRLHPDVQAMYPLKIRTVKALVEEKIAYCQGIIDKDQRTLDHADAVEERGGNASELLSWARSGIKMWTQTRKGWESYLETYRKMGRLDLEDPRVLLLLQAISDYPDRPQMELWDLTLSKHFDGQGKGRFNFSYVERMMPRLQRWRFVLKGKRNALRLGMRGHRLLAARAG